MGRPKTALVLSGGGVRGAYEVGVVAGMVEALGLGPDDRCPFDVFAGTSVGAINATFLAAGADRGDMDVGRLVELWESLRLDVHLRIELLELGFLPRLLGHRYRQRGPTVGWSLLNPRPLERLVTDGIPWARLHRNVSTGRVHAAIVAALEIATGRTCMFAELADGAVFRASRDPHRASRCEPLSASHVLASAAIPILYPARRIGAHYYYDGGLRFNTPLAPAIRVGSERLVIIPMLRQMRPDEPMVQAREYPSLAFLAGKLINGLLADPITYDLQVLVRFNRLLEVLHEALTPAERERVDALMRETRGARYRTLETLVFRPTCDIGVEAGRYIATAPHLQRGLYGRVLRMILRRTGVSEADWASYVLFDGGFARDLIDMGRRDALARADDVRAFFA